MYASAQGMLKFQMVVDHPELEEFCNTKTRVTEFDNMLSDDLITGSVFDKMKVLDCNMCDVRKFRIQHTWIDFRYTIL